MPPFGPEVEDDIGLLLPPRSPPSPTPSNPALPRGVAESRALREPSKVGDGKDSKELDVALAFWESAEFPNTSATVVAAAIATAAAERRLIRECPLTASYAAA